MDNYSERFHPRTTLGQNFLIDKNVVEKIIRTSEISVNDVILEIGPGKGILTRGILNSPCRKIYSVEIDRRLEKYLKELESFDSRLNIIWEDAVKYSYQDILHDPPNKVVANLPYNITTPILWKLLEVFSSCGLSRLVVMVQKESALRLCGKNSTRERYPLGITIQTMGTINYAMKVSRQSFRPVPDVDSVVVDILLFRNLHLPSNILWRRILKAGFSQRRKTLVKNLLMADFQVERKEIETFLSELGLNKSARAEELSCENWLEMLSFLKHSLK